MKAADDNLVEMGTTLPLYREAECDLENYDGTKPVLITIISTASQCDTHNSAALLPASPTTGACFVCCLALVAILELGCQGLNPSSEGDRPRQESFGAPSSTGSHQSLDIIIPHHWAHP